MGSRYPKSEVGVRVHAKGYPDKTGVIVNADSHDPVTVKWDADGKTTVEYRYCLTDVESKRRAAERALKRWS